LYLAILIRDLIPVVTFHRLAMPLKRVTAQASHSLWHKSDITLDSSPQIPRVETFCPKMGTFCQVILLSFGSGIVLLAMQLRFTRDQKSVFVTGLG
jgi:hypothetical protein